MKILVCHVPAGAGHQRAAEATASAIRERAPLAETILVDATRHADRAYRWAFLEGYLGLVQKAPFLWGAGYYLTDFKPLSGLFRRLHRLSNRLHGKELERFFIEAKADVIVSSHFFPLEVAARLKAAGRISGRVLAVVTDYLPHTFWTAPGVDRYIVGSPEAEQEMLSRGIPPEKIRVLGIPVDPKFTLPLDRSALMERFGLSPDRLTLLVGAGGAGSGPVERLVRLLAKVPHPIQILVVAGRNAALADALERLRPTIPHPMKVFGFVDFMHELMTASDLIVTKPGGLTCAEALAKGLPMILAHPIPGQESRNASVLARMGVAIRANRLEEIPGRIRWLLENRRQLQDLGRKARQASRAEAAARIAEEALGR